MFDSDRYQNDTEIVNKLETPSVFFSDQGALKRQKKDFQWRPQQKEMAEAVMKAFSEKEVLFAEAGTGTGKSFAYLYPAILQALLAEERVVITTQTIALQEQVYFKDLPYLERILGISLKKSIAKGRGNYLCLRKKTIRYEDDYLSVKEKEFLKKIHIWSDATKDGDKEEAGLHYEEWSFWNQVSSNSEDCYGSSCPHYRECFYFRQKRMIEKSQLIVTNHSLLIRDVKMNHKLLPEYHSLVIDEGHNFPDEWINQYTDTFDCKKELYQADYLLKHRQSPLKKLEKHFKENIFYKDLALYIEKNNNHFEQLKVQLESMAEALGGHNTFFSHDRRIRAEHQNEEYYMELFEKASAIMQTLKMAAGVFNDILLALENSELYDDLILDVKLTFTQINEKIKILEWFCKPDFDKNVYWIRQAKIFIAPLDVSEGIRNKFFSPDKSFVITSATLTVNHSFSFIFRSFGISEKEATVLHLDSPFDYRKQARLLYTDKELQDQTMMTTLSSMVDQLQGGTLVLFTNHDLLRKTFYYLQETYPQKTILADGISGSRRTVTALFRKSKDAVLLGADSFWEGIDLEGDLLKHLIMTKLPFLPPNRPVVEATMEKIQSQGGNHFYDYSIPKAVIKFRQGFGRLIRSSDDQGSFYVLDHRVFSKAYGKIFLKSIPEMDKTLIKMVN